MEYTKKELEDIIKKYIKKDGKNHVSDILKNKEAEKEIRGIVSDVIEDLYRAFWVKRTVWKNEIK